VDLEVHSSQSQIGGPSYCRLGARGAVFNSDFLRLGRLSADFKNFLESHFENGIPRFYVSTLVIRYWMEI